MPVGTGGIGLNQARRISLYSVSLQFQFPVFQLQFPVSSFQFPVSSFRLPVVGACPCSSVSSVACDSIP